MSVVIREPFCLRLRRLRLAAGLSKIKLASRAGMTRANVYYLESERLRQDPRLATLLRLADALGVSLDVLAGRETT